MKGKEKEMNEKIRIRTITECVDMLHEEDPGNTTVTVHGLRMLVACGEIPHRRVGRKILLNYDIVRNYYMMADEPVRQVCMND